MDDETFTIEFHTDSIDSWSNGTNIVGVRVLLTYSEDETSNGIGCLAPGASDPQPDDIIGVVLHEGYNGSGTDSNEGQGSSSHEIVIEWYNASLIGEVTGVSETQINSELNAMETGLGEYVLDITVESESGGSAGCQHSDDGEEVEYVVELIILDYKVEKRS